jgi:hypothetical protein
LNNQLKAVITETTNLILEALKKIDEDEIYFDEGCIIGSDDTDENEFISGIYPKTGKVFTEYTNNPDPLNELELKSLDVYQLLWILEQLEEDNY